MAVVSCHRHAESDANDSTLPPTKIENSSMESDLLITTSKVSFFYFPGIFASVVLTVVNVNNYVIFSLKLLSLSYWCLTLYMCLEKFGRWS